jgi:hypothetical protein
MVFIDDFGARMQISMTAVASFPSGLQGSRLRCPWTKRRVGLGSHGGGECELAKERGRGASDSVAFVPSSLHTTIGFLFFSLATDHGTALGALEGQGVGMGTEWR